MILSDKPREFFLTVNFSGNTFTGHGPIAQWSERRAHNSMVPGSSPGGPNPGKGGRYDVLLSFTEYRARFKAWGDHPYAFCEFSKFATRARYREERKRGWYGQCGCDFKTG